MTIVRYKPFNSLFGYPRWMDSFDENFTLPFKSPKNLNVRETDKAIVIDAVVAGVPKKDVVIEIDDGVLTIKAEKKEEKKTEQEFRSSSFQYYYTTALSGGDWKKAEADINDGVVTVTIPKTKVVRPKKITIKTK